MRLPILLLLAIVPIVFMVDCKAKKDDKEDERAAIYYMQYKPSSDKEAEGEVQLCRQENGNKSIMRKWHWESAGGGSVPDLTGPVFSSLDDYNRRNQLFVIELDEDKRIILIDRQGKITDIELGEFPETKAFGETGSQSPLWFSDGEKFLFCSGAPAGTGLYLYDIKTGKVKSYLKGWFIYEPRWYDPDKSIIFEKSNEGSGEKVKRLDTMLFDLKTLKTKLLIPRTR